LRNIIIYMTLTFSLSSQVNAQKFYAAIGLGYYKNSFSFPVTNGLNVIYQTKPHGSVGYILNNKLCVELGINQLSYSYTGDDYFNWFISIRMLRLMPSLKYTYYSHGTSYAFYAKAGMSIGLDNYMRQDFEYHNDMPYTLEILKSEYKGGLAPGYVFAIGGECKIYRGLSFYAELTGIYNYWSRSDKVNIIELTGFSDDIIDRTPMKVHTGGVHAGLKYSFN
jgi:hypothetical protein